MNEEWYNDNIRATDDYNWVGHLPVFFNSLESFSYARPFKVTCYDVWLEKLLLALQANSGTRDKTFTQFLIDLPSIPQQVLTLLQRFSAEPTQ